MAKLSTTSQSPQKYSTSGLKGLNWNRASMSEIIFQAGKAIWCGLLIIFDMAIAITPVPQQQDSSEGIREFDPQTGLRRAIEYFFGCPFKQLTSNIDAALVLEALC